MIRIFIGSHKRFARCEPVIEHSIRKYASELVEINIMRPEYYGCEDSGCTGFSKMRWEVPRICNYEGHAIYLDVDMILQADIAKSRRYKSIERFVAMEDKSNEVMVIDCRDRTRKYDYLIPPEWNIEDYLATPKDLETAKLIHYTDLKFQPWSFDSPEQHPKPWLAKIWFDVEADALEANT